MGSLLSQCVDWISDILSTHWPRRSRIVLLGLDGAGKTTLLYKLKLGKPVTVTPTACFNMEKFQFQSISFTAFDISGQKRLRQVWECYFPDCDAIIYVVDASDRSRIDEAAQELHRIFQHQALCNAKLLVFANKQDHRGCMTIDEIQTRLNLSAVTKSPTHVEMSSAASGLGVNEGFSWLCNEVTGRDTKGGGCRRSHPKYKWY